MSEVNEKLLKETAAIKMLLLLLLVKLGSDSKEIGMALGVKDGTVRSWISMKQVEKIVTSAGDV